MPVSVGDSFNRALPSVSAAFHGTGVPRPKTHISGLLTAEAEPPRIGFLTPLNLAYIPYAEQILGKDTIKSYLRQHSLATWEASRSFFSEANVGEATALQLLNPVDLALLRRYSADNPMRARNEETRHHGAVRTDRTWSREVSPGAWRPFAILEYKKVGVIRPDELQAACRLPSEFSRAMNNLLAKGAESLFTENAEKILKQATNYANMYETRYIAFFDWDTMLLLILGDQEGHYGGEWCYVTLVRHRADMRKALLGFLVRAYQEANRGRLERPTS